MSQNAPVNPYADRPERHFWRPAVAARHVADLADLWSPLAMTRETPVATAGSCFAQHIGRRLKARGANYMDLEPAPPFLRAPEVAQRFGFGLFSCRYGNIYTSRQLIQLVDEAFGRRAPLETVWRKGERFFDALRPSVDPAGQPDAEAVQALRRAHLARVREMFETVGVFVFTLGLTEGWEHVEDGTMYPMAPGTLCGAYDPERYRFRNLTHAEILADVEGVLERLKTVNPSARLLLTVSPVPLTATASAEHVLVATMHSKSTLRSVAGELAAAHADVFYFPSYELIAGHPSRGAFFNPDLRTVNPLGVEVVMEHFFAGPMADAFAERADAKRDDSAVELVCDEEQLEAARG